MKYNGKNFDEVIEAHKIFMETGGTEGSCADFSNCDCSNLVFCNLALNEANFSSANLKDALFDMVYMYDVNFDGADLHKVLFRCSMIEFCSFRRAFLVGTEFLGTIVHGCDFEDSCLVCATFRSTAEVSGCTFLNANMDGVYVRDVRFSANEAITADKDIKKTSSCPDTGSFIGWKKAVICPKDECTDYVIIKLEIPEEAKRSSAFGRKCRASEARVLGIWQIKNNEPDFEHPVDVAYSLNVPEFKYVTGQTVTPTVPYDDNPYNECASGIHFFITMQEAIDY